MLKVKCHVAKSYSVFILGKRSFAPKPFVGKTFQTFEKERSFVPFRLVSERCSFSKGVFFSYKRFRSDAPFSQNVNINKLLSHGIKPLLFFFFLFFFLQNVLAQEVTLKDCFLENKGRATFRIIEDNHGFIWWMRQDGFYRFDGKSIDFIDPMVDVPNSNFHSASSILPQKNGDYWFAARSLGLAIYDAANDKFRHIPTLSDGDSTYHLYTRDIAEITPDADTKFVAGNNGIWLIDRQGNVQKHLQPAIPFGKLKWGRHNANEVRKMIYDSKRNILWIGGMAGLLSYHLDSEKLMLHPNSFKNARTNDNHFLINDILLNGDELTVTTWGGGLMTFDIQKEKWEQFIFKDEQHLPSRSGMTQLGQTENGRLFFPHEIREVGSWKKGESFFDIPNIDGSPLEKGIAAQVDRLGYLWIGHWRKVCKYIVKEEPPTAKSAQIYVHSIFADSILLKQKMHRWDGQKVLISQKMDTLKFVFRAINPLSYDSIFYEYKLDGVDADWKKNKNNEVAIYQNLKNGSYQFQARYFDKISRKYIYTDKVFVKIKIENLVSQKLVIGLLSLLGLSFLGFFYYRNLVEKRRQKKEKQYQTQLREVQDAALRSQMNPHFLFNSLNSIRYFIVTKDNEKATEYLTKFSRLIRMILENSKKKLVSLEEELQMLKLYVNMEQIRFENKFDYEVKMPSEINPSGIMIPPMLIQPFIENAILHGINPKDGRGKITLSFKKEMPFLIISIEDDGIGRANAKALKQDSVFKKESLGLSITQSRLDLADSKSYQAKLEIIDLCNDEKEAVGTRVLIWLPVFS
ncbi:MAG TPA: hypothetical protein ENJ53_02640 [Phaeodactylibacter sp.]|nr:hypothetical protein [Phaeodactylibacter sp.]